MNRPDLTAERFVPDPFSADPHARLYKTGDLGRYLADGNVEFLGRNDFQVKIRGFRVELGEIEAKLAALPQVQEAVVMAREGAAGDKRLVAYIVAQAGVDIDAAQLRGALATELADYMVPSAFVLLAAMPVTPNGKLDRKALPAPDDDAFIAQAYEAPQGALEESLAAVWSSVLKREQVGRHDNFFELGGHSLLAVTLIERMREAGLAADVRTLFATPTIAALAAEFTGNPKQADNEVVVPPNGIAAHCAAITPDMLPLVALSQQQIDRIARAVPGGMPNIQDIYPLAPLQEGILFHHLMHQTGDAYLLQNQLAFDSRARLDGFIAALQAVIDRHDILRTAVVWEGLDAAVQVVWRDAQLLIEDVVVDAGDVPAALQARFDPGHYRIDVTQAPLMRGFVAHDPGNGRWLLQLLNHHLVSDHTTLEILVDEIRQVMQGEVLAPAVPFRNYVAQARLGIPQEQHEAFFTEMLGDVDEPTAPFGLLDVQGIGADVEEAVRDVEAGLAGRIRRQAKRLGISSAALMHLAWAQVLGKVSGTGAGKTDVVFGTVLFGRMQGGAGASRALGLFINTLPIRIDVGSQPVEQAARETHARLSQLLRHEHAPLALAQRCSGVQAPAPLFTSVLNFRHSAPVAASTEHEAAGWEGIHAMRGEERTNYPFGLSVDDLGDGFALKAQVSASVGAQRVCGYMHAALDSLVGALETAPDTAMGELGILPAQEWEQLVHGWNRTAAAYPHDQCVHQLFEAQAAATPDAVAVVFEEQQLSYQELNDRANRLAHHLRERGVAPDSLVAICVLRSVEMIVGLLAVLKAGGAYVPLDPSYPLERLRFMVEDCAPVAILAHRATMPLLHELGSDAELLDLEAHQQQWIERAPCNLPAEVTGVTAQHLAYVIYTSGSTGKPKGVLLAHRGLCNLVTAQARAFGIDAHSRVLQFTAFGFDVSTSEIAMSLCTGATLCLASKDHLQLHAPLLATIDKHAVTHLHLPYPVLAALPEGTVLGSVHTIIVGGETCAPAVANQWIGKYRLFNAYGPTETTVSATHYLCRTRQDSQVPIGRPLANTRLYILDERMQPAPVGVAGELYIGGAGVARGYLKRPDLTAERFVADPFSDEAGALLYKTGDLGHYLSDGNIGFQGRNDDQVKIRGFRIELGEIEAALAALPHVREAAVLVRADGTGQDGASDKRLVAYLVPSAGSRIDAAQLREALLHDLAEYMVPSAFVVLDAMPLTPNGKLDRRALPAPDADAFIAQAYEAPQDEVEVTLAAIWSAILKRDRIGRQDNFFELGGHSLLAVQMNSRLRQQMQIDLPLGELFKEPTLAGFAARARQAERLALPPIVPIDRTRPVPLSFAQQRLYFLAQIEGVSQAYHISGGVRLIGALDRPALEAALNRIVARHEMLRTSFGMLDGEALQTVHPAAGMTLAYQDLRSRGAATPVLEETLGQLASALFDLEHGPVIRAGLLRLADDEHVLFIAMHHIVSDGWSMGILIGEFSALYGAYHAGLAVETDPLPALPIQYADFAQWQRTWLDAQRQSKYAAYWQQTLAGIAPLLELPADRPRPAQQRFDGGLCEVMFDQTLSAKLKALSHRHGTTLYMTLIASWAALLARLSGQDDVVIGSPMAGRHRSEVEGLIGMFVNTLALRFKFPPEQTVAQLLEQSKRQVLDAQTHQDLPFEQIVDIVQPPRSMAHSPIFQVMFALQNTPEGSLELPGLRLEPVGASTGAPTAKFDLNLELQEVEGRIVGSLVYATALYDAATIERHIGHWTTLLEAMVERDDQILGSLPLMNPDQCRQVLVEWNATEHDYAQDVCLHQLVEAQAARTPDAIAVQFEERSLSYRELNDRANRLGHYLRQRGVQPDTLVAICAERSIEMIVGLLGILKAGGAYVPLDPAYPAERIAGMLEDSRPALVLTQQALRSTVPASAPVWCLDSQWPELDGYPSSNPAALAQPHHLAYVIYTSGSTGKPKGAMNEHRGIVNRLLWMQERYGLTVDDCVLQKTPFSFDVSVWELFWPLLAGARLHFARPDGHRDPVYLSQAIAAAGVSTLHFVPSMLQVFLEQADASRYARLKRVICSGEALPAPLAKRFHAALPGVELHNLYGPTEAAVDVTAWQCRPHDTGHSTPLGRPIANTRMYILDERMQPAPVGVAGELYIGGVQVGRGYLNRPELTAERFVPDPFSPEPFNDRAAARLYKTGDLARYLADGNIDYLGRNDFQVKLRGFRIELGEIEAQLVALSQVKEAVVIARDDSPDQDSGDKRLVAYVVAQEGHTVDAAELRTALLNALADYMVPHVFVVLNAMPVTANGKLDRNALPAPHASDQQSLHVAPRTPVETVLCGIWKALLAVDTVGVHDDFYRLGGNSLKIMRFVAEAAKAGLAYSVKTVMQHPTIAELAVRCQEQGVRQEDAGVTVGQVQLTSAQQRFLATTTDRPQWADIHDVFDVPELDLLALRQALHDVCSYHDALRARFTKGPAGWMQEILAPEAMELAIELVDCSALSDAEQIRHIDDLMRADQGSMELETPSLIRVHAFFRGKERGYVVRINLHHLIVDGYSKDMVLDGLTQCYMARVAGHAHAFPAKRASFAAWMDALTGYVNSPAIEQETSYWMGQPWDRVARIRADRQVAPGENNAGSNVDLQMKLSAQATAGLRRFASRYLEGALVNVVIAALMKTLEGYIQGHLLPVRVLDTGRGFDLGIDPTGLVGWLCVQRVLPLQMSEPGEDLLTSVRRVHREIQEVPNAGLGFELLQCYHRDEALRAGIDALPKTELFLNFYDVGDGQEAVDPAPAPAPEDRPFSSLINKGEVELSWIAPLNVNNEKFTCNAFTVDGGLKIIWRYSRNLYEDDNMTRLAGQLVDTLTSIAGLIPDADGQAGTM